MLHDKLQDQGFEVVAFPSNSFNQEPLEGQAIEDHAKGFGARFAIMAKTPVNGSNTHPVFAWLKSKASGFLLNAIKWNYTKFLVDRDGTPVKRYSPRDSPSSMEGDIMKLLEKPSKL
eukprot:TRINITY_DN11660_c1_g9_i2.p1 TRINITY_DN11660_c1_g9~~TRINITY_DN11660_c1_g9_i2.p1  ORF type:complete len:117 (+),score=31.83 TRINITY_DN11660_c1_g9_i2:277-627(+)